MQKRFLKTLLVKSALILLFQLNFSFSQNNGSVYGFVTDSSNGEALIGANVFIADLALGMATDVNGYYVLQEIPQGSYEVSVSYVGYKILRQKIDISNNQLQTGVREVKKEEPIG
jgi:hypothetical protein